MRFVYATRPLPKLEFATANQREAIPAEAEVFAVCDGSMTIRQQHEHAVCSLTEQEQSTLEQLIAESEISEAKLQARTDDYGFVRRIIKQLLSI